MTQRRYVPKSKHGASRTRGGGLDTRVKLDGDVPGWRECLPEGQAIRVRLPNRVVTSPGSYADEVRQGAVGYMGEEA